MKQSSNKFNLLVFVIVGLLVLIRLWQYNTNPPALNWDEVSHGINAANILTTSKDEWGVKFPHIFRAFGDYKLPVYIYLTALGVAVFGLNEYSVRIVSVIAGIVTCFFVYLILKKELKDREAATIGLFTALILPWHFFISRVALEANLSLAFLVGGFYGVFMSGRKAFVNLGLVAFALSMHTYNSARVVVPFLFLVSLWWLVKNKQLKTSIPGIAVFVLASVLVGYQIISGSGLSRYQKLNILSENNVYQIGQMRANSKLPPLVVRFVYNRPTYLGYRVLSNYVNYFSIGFLTQTSGPQAQFAIPGLNLLTWTNTVMAGVGAIYLIYKKKTRAMIVFILVALAFLPAALTDSTPQALRPLYAIPLFLILITYGYKVILRQKKTAKYIALVVIGIMSLEFANYSRVLAQEYPAKYSNAWQYGYKQVVGKVNNLESQFERVIVTKYYGEPHVFFAFYGSYPPSALMPNEDNVRFKQSDWYWTDKVEKYYFVNDWEIGKDGQNIKTESGLLVPLKGSLLVTTGQNLFPGSKEVDRVYDLDSESVFVISVYE